VIAPLPLLAAACEPGMYYGLGGGYAAPMHESGGSASLAARIEYQPPPRSMGSYFAAEGALLGFAGPDSRGLVPLLLGSGGGSFGAARLYLEGGLHGPGYLERYDHHVLGLVGLVGGAGLALTLGERAQLHLTARVLWSSPTTQIDLQAGRKVEFVYFLTGLTLYLRARPATPPPLDETAPRELEPTPLGPGAPRPKPGAKVVDSPAP
jgi:hypothetical protein